MSFRFNTVAVRDFLSAVVLLAVALFFALASRSAMLNGDSAGSVLFALLSLLLASFTAVKFVPPIVRRIDFGRWRLPLSFSVTREGGYCFLAIFILSVAALNSGNNLLYLILALAMSAIITSGVVARISLRALSVSLQVPENVFEGENVPIKVSLKNQKRFFSSFSILIEDLDLIRSRKGRLQLMKRLFRKRVDKADIPDRSVLRHSAYFPFIPAGETRSELVTQSFPRRGLYRLNGLQVSTRFPFGFFRRGERMQGHGEVLAYPSVREISSYFHLLPFLPGSLEGMRPGAGESLHAIRSYQEGESVRIIDWKATAKTDSLMAREYAREEENRFCLILDTIIPKPPQDYAAKFEKAVSLAASVACHFFDEGAELEFLMRSRHVPRGSGIEHLYAILRALALVEFELVPSSSHPDFARELSGAVDAGELERLLSDKVFKIVITSRPHGSFPGVVWRSSHVVYFDEL